MQSLQDIMGKKSFDEPPEVQAIKTFIRKNFSADAKISVTPHSITITVSSASLAGAIRPMLYKMKEELSIKKKTFLRIG